MELPPDVETFGVQYEMEVSSIQDTREIKEIKSESVSVNKDQQVQCEILCLDQSSTGLTVMVLYKA
ncbi:hypothetical protein KUTeg_012722 [Tegillarca granosa]|uniref:Uncharacterized protein n=1 Tax=Tegillarca granosa TaxID=220873 RepID=A0ABQ9F4N2_TEGGR|nr:hypothetical protein KUTeg_012722 [Tegillarca granosa]